MFQAVQILAVMPIAEISGRTVGDPKWGGSGIFTDRDQQSIFMGFEFQKSVFFELLVTATVYFLGSQ